MAAPVLKALLASYMYVVALFGLDISARTIVHLPGAFEGLKEDGPIAIFVTYLMCPAYITSLLALGSIVKLTDATFCTIDAILDAQSRFLSFFSPKLSFAWRTSWDTRAVINIVMDDIHSALKVFINISPYAVLVAPIADPCTKGFQKAKASRWTAWLPKLTEGISKFAYGVFLSPIIHFAVSIYNMYMDTMATMTSWAISSWVAANTLPVYFLWAMYNHGLRGAIGLTAAHGVTFAPSSVAPALHRTAATFLGGIGIDCPKLIPDPMAGKAKNSTAVNLTASSTATPP